MPRIHVCEECGGSGAQVYERGPAAERCPRCGGVGLRFADPRSAARDLRDLLTGAGADDPELLALGPGGAARALAAALALVEERLAETERELARRR